MRPFIALCATFALATHAPHANSQAPETETLPSDSQRVAETEAAPVDAGVQRGTPTATDAAPAGAPPADAASNPPASPADAATKPTSSASDSAAKPGTAETGSAATNRAEIDRKLEEAKKEFVPMMRDGQQQYCKKEQPIGSRLPKWLCLTEAQLVERIRANADLTNRMNLPKPCVGEGCRGG